MLRVDLHTIQDLAQTALENSDKIFNALNDNIEMSTIDLNVWNNNAMVELNYNNDNLDINKTMLYLRLRISI